MARAPGTWHPEDIKAALRKRHGSLRAACRKWGYSRTGITMVLLDPSYSRPLEQKIASDLGVKPHILWPDRWAADGSPIPRGGETSPITAKQPESCQKRKAA